MAIDAKIPITAITINNSISVKPVSTCLAVFVFIIPPMTKSISVRYHLKAFSDLYFVTYSRLYIGNLMIFQDMNPESVFEKNMSSKILKKFPC